MIHALRTRDWAGIQCRNIPCSCYRPVRQSAASFVDVRGKTRMVRKIRESKKKDRTSKRSPIFPVFAFPRRATGSAAGKWRTIALGSLLSGRSRRRGDFASGRSRRRSDFATAARGNRSAASRSDFAAAARGNRSAASRSGFATASRHVTAAAVLAAEQAVATIATVATITAVAAIAAVAANALGTAAISHSAAVATATMTQQASVGLFFTAHQGDTDDREENRDATQNKTIHCESSKKSYTYRKRNDNLPMPSERPRLRRQVLGCDRG